ncbi:MAG: sulfite exporter TauE/SafE family protein [Vulcanimicrobiaceae bacterium]
MLLATGVAPVPASATNNVAMWLGSLASTGSFRSEIDIPRPALTKMLVASVAGTILGAILLLRTSNAAFTTLIPLLLAAATAIFIAGPELTRRSQRMTAALTVESPLGLLTQFAIAVYGGFFGAAMGILMLALLGILGMHDLRRANAFKLLLSTVINGVAVVPFVIARAIAWEPAIAMSVGAIAGGYLGAGVVKRMPSATIRAFVTVIAVSMTAYFTWKTYVIRS